MATWIRVFSPITTFLCRNRRNCFRYINNVDVNVSKSSRGDRPPPGNPRIPAAQLAAPAQARHLGQFLSGRSSRVACVAGVSRDGSLSNLVIPAQGETEHAWRALLAARSNARAQARAGANPVLISIAVTTNRSSRVRPQGVYRGTLESTRPTLSRRPRILLSRHRAPFSALAGAVQPHREQCSRSVRLHLFLCSCKEKVTKKKTRPPLRPWLRQGCPALLGISGLHPQAIHGLWVKASPSMARPLRGLIGNSCDARLAKGAR